MDQLLTIFWHAGSFFLGVSCVIFTFFVRRIVETSAPSLKKVGDENDGDITYENAASVWWNGVILYAIPVIWGGFAAAYWRDFFTSGKASELLSNAIMFGVIIGWFSSFFYKVVRKTLKKKTGIDPVPGPIDFLTNDDDDEEEDGESDEKV